MRKQNDIKNVMVIGCGMITEHCHLPAILRSRRVRVVALVDNNVKNAVRLKKKYSLSAPAVNDLMAVKERVDGAVIATPNNTHYAIAKSCLEKNISVLIEKPMCNMVDEADKLCDLVKEKEAFISVGYSTRYYPSVVLFKKLLVEGYFGKILGFEYEFGTVGGWAPMSGYNIDRKESGGGVLVVNGTHILDRLLFWFGKPANFVYRDDSHGGVEANCKAELSYNNTIGQFSGSMFLSKTAVLKNRFLLRAEKMSCEIIEGQTDTVTIHLNDGDLKHEVSDGRELYVPGKNPFEAQLDNFIRCMDGETVPRVDCDAARESVSLIEMMYSKREKLDEPWVIRIKK